MKPNLTIRGLQRLLFRVVLERLDHMECIIMATQKELAEDLKTLTEKVTKIGQETSGLSQKITDLQTALDAAGGTTPEVDAAVEALRTSIHAVDDMVEDLPVPAPEEEPPTP